MRLTRSSSTDAFEEPPTRDGMPSDTANKAMWAAILLVSTWKRARGFQGLTGLPAYDKSGAGRVFPILSDNQDTALGDAMQQVVKHAVIEAHLRTTLRKMGQGLKCSLRFFPEGELLRPTNRPVAAGSSLTRLDNVMGILTDVGCLSRGRAGHVLTDRGQALLSRLGGLYGAE